MWPRRKLTQAWNVSPPNQIPSFSLRQTRGGGFCQGSSQIPFLLFLLCSAGSEGVRIKKKKKTSMWFLLGGNEIRKYENNFWDVWSSPAVLCPHFVCVCVHIVGGISGLLLIFFLHPLACCQHWCVISREFFGGEKKPCKKSYVGQLGWQQYQLYKKKYRELVLRKANWWPLNMHLGGKNYNKKNLIPQNYNTPKKCFLQKKVTFFKSPPVHSNKVGG